MAAEDQPRLLPPVIDTMFALPASGFWTGRIGAGQASRSFGRVSAAASLSPYFALEALLVADVEAGGIAHAAPNAGRTTAPAMQVASVAPAAPRATLFGAKPIRFGAIPSGKRLAAEIRRSAGLDHGMLCGNQPCAAKVRGFAGGISPAGNDVEALAAEVNRQVNARIAYAEDRKTHAVTDYWSMPAETILSGRGDCEDFAVLKMGLMAELGVPMSDLAVVVVRDTRRRLYHAVLAVSTESGTLILDNMRDENRIDTDLPDYAPLFAVSGSGNYIFGYTKAQKLEIASAGNVGAVAPGAGF